MTPEQRLDRLERIAQLMVKAGLRARRHAREQDEKLDILIDAQIQSEARQARSDERQARSDERLDRLAEAQARSDARQVRSDERLDRLVETVDRYIQERRNGNP